MNTYNPSDNILLYAKFDNTKDSFVVPPTVEVLFIKDNEITTLLNAEMQTNDNIDYFYNYKIPEDVDFGQYQVIYTGYYGDTENKLFEDFYVVNYKSDVNPIRIYGFIHDYNTHKQIENVQVDILNLDDNNYYLSFSNLIGQWECYLYAGSYRFIFKKTNYKDQIIEARITDELQQVEFNNVLLEEISTDNKGNGVFEVKEQYLLKNDQPIEGLNVIIYDINDLKTEVVNTYIDSDGWWYAYLDTGNYLVKVKGSFNGLNYDKTFRLKVKNNGDFDMQDISKNEASNSTAYIPNGKGSIDYRDSVLDKDNKPIPDVQVNILDSSNKIKYQCYTDLNGEFIFHLDAGTYNFEFYHPSFKTITKKIVIK